MKKVKRIVAIVISIVLISFTICIITNFENYKYFKFWASIFGSVTVSESIYDSKNIAKVFIKEYSINSVTKKEYSAFDNYPIYFWVEKQWMSPNLFGYISVLDKDDAFTFVLKIDTITNFNKYSYYSIELGKTLKYEMDCELRPNAYNGSICCKMLQLTELRDTLNMYLIKKESNKLDTIMKYLLIGK